MAYKIWPTDSVIRRWPTAKARTWVGRFLDLAIEDPNILAVVAVGSAVRKSVESDDVDLVAICSDCGIFDHKAPIEVDLHAFAVDQVDTELSDGHPLLGWAVRFGRVLFDREETWADIESKWKERVPLPDPELARRQAEKPWHLAAELRSLGDTLAADEQKLTYLTLLARAVLSEKGVYPASRPELPGQLRSLGERHLAEQLEKALRRRAELEAEPVLQEAV